MADISACSGQQCEVRDSCHRFTCVKGYWQSYGGFVPSSSDGCEMFWDNSEEIKEVDSD